VKTYYRRLTHYKYQLMEEYQQKIDIKPANDILLRFLELHRDGLLIVRKAYAWDGPSGPTFDSKNFMRGSLVHDALYQLMRLRALDYKVYRKRVDEILRECCREDGMSAFRAWYVFLGVRLFGFLNAKPRNEPEVKIIDAP